MLVLSRQKDQTIMIGDDIGVTVVDIRGDKVRLGVTAPKSVSVHRREIYDSIRNENLRASQLRPDDVGFSTRPQRGMVNAAGIPAESGRSDARNGVEEGFMDEFLRAAVEEAKIGADEGGLPIGSVLVREGRIIGRGHNRRVQKGDPMAHAEIECLRQAGRQKNYGDTVLYSTLMPCYLCSGAVLQFGIPRVVVGESVNFAGGCVRGRSSPELLRASGVDVADTHDPTCIAMMRAFIEAHPDLWNEDIGR